MSTCTMGDPNVTIVVGKKKFNCRRDVLAAKSAYFQSMFSLDMTEKRCSVVELKDVDSCAVKMLIEYAKDGKCDIRSRNVNNLLLASDMLLFETVREACVDFLQNHLNVTNCLGIMSLVESLAIEQLYLRAKQLALWEFAQVIQHSEFLQLSVEQLHSYLSYDGLRAKSELDIFNAVMVWVNHSPDDRTHQLVNLLDVIRFGLVNLKDVIRICKAVKSCNACYLLVKEIWFHKKSVKRSASSKGSWSADYASDAGSTDSDTVSKAGSSLDVTVSCGEVNNGEDDSYPESKRLKRCNKLVEGKRDADPGAGLNGSLLQVNMSALVAVANDRPRRIPIAPAIIGYIFDGDNVRSRPPDLAIYDPVSKTVSKIAVVDKVGQSYHVAIGYKACVIGNEMFVVGGEFCYGLSKWNPAVWKYNTFSGTWKFVANLQVPRRHHALAVLNNRIYVIGGVGRFRIPLDAVEVLNVTTGTWSVAAKLPEPLYCPVCTAYKNKIYVFSTDVYRYDPRSNAWTQMRQMRHTSILSSRGSLVLALEHDKGIFLVTGSQLIFYDPDVSDPSGSFFKILGSFSHEIQNACVIGDLVYAFNQDGSLVVEVYDYSQNKYHSESFDDLKAPVSGNGCFALPWYVD